MVATVAVDTVTELTATAGKDGDDVNLYEMWRKSLANETSMGTTLTQQGLICNGLTWSWEADMAGDMSNYANYSWLSASSIPDGRFFGYVAITLWVGYVFQELRSIFSYLCLLSLGAPPDDGPTFVYDHCSGSGRLTGLTRGMRAAVLGVASVRLILCLSLGVFGIRFLAYTTNLSDFILNSVA
eukprot:CAMPEP_0176128126 /NCGR_PEP_ID=MMETSP0120_2-20121206/64734_1 /TAXON_ID=160619 /ORGANISM="Kryptoperidinium foliaceum, Strain CCMP 1326" /LENGTH=183 /DNA_ID=CAMNT_0017463201 /DNA_START=15 /DNA_END=563 /DNA_ORIENTATION=-